MIRIRLSTILGAKRITIADVARDTGLARSVVTRYYHEQSQRVDLQVLETLIEYLGVELSDLLQVEEADATAEAPGHSGPS